MDRKDLLLRHFFTRPDCAAVLAQWGTPCPVDLIGAEETLLDSHLYGDTVPSVTASRLDKGYEQELITGHFRVGSYTPDCDGNTAWICIDVDGPGHAHAVADPLAATLAIQAAFEAHGIPSYLEKSGGGQGWHIWIFFDPMISADKARQLALALIPRDIPTAAGGFADPARNRGVEVFPKQAKIDPNGYGNMVWLPWWFGAPEGANQFHHLNGDGTLHRFEPEAFTTVAEAQVDTTLAALAHQGQPEVAVSPNPPDAKKSHSVTGDAWKSWREDALAKLDLNTVYGEWLTGEAARNGWLECRVPWSPSGDRNPSGGVADGTGDAERGAFHDFIGGRTLSVFDFLIETGRATDFKAACEVVADLSGLPLPAISSQPPWEPHDPIRLTELGNARRLAKLHGEDLRFVANAKKWYAWDGRRWCPDETGEIHRRMKATVRSIYGEAARREDSDMREKTSKWAVKSESEKVIRAGITLAQSEASLAILPTAFDTNPWVLNCANGTLNLRTGLLGKHRREDLITRLAPVAFDPSATCPVWECYLDHVTGADKELQTFLKRSVGYSLTGDISAQVLFMLYGTGENGKSTFLEVLEALFGDYALHTPTETLMVKRQSGIPNDQARLAGARLITAVEVEDGHRMSESLVKQWTGGDTVTARFLNREFFQFKPCGKIWLAVNHKPQVRGTDHAIWRRIRLIPFSVRITKEERDDHLAEKLRLELPGILNWAVQGCLKWQDEGLGEPSGVVTATNDYRTEMDVLGNFLGECCLAGDGYKVQSSQLYAAYANWCDKSHESTLTMTKFAERLKDRGFEKKKSDGLMNWQGIGLRADSRTAGGEPGDDFREG